MIKLSFGKWILLFYLLLTICNILFDSDDQITFTDERKEELISLSKKDDIYDRLAKALAPSIYENEDIKKGILCQLFGAAKKDFEDTGRSKFRYVIQELEMGCDKLI